MNIYDQVHKAYTDALKNNFRDAWGIVSSPRVFHELRAECMEHMVVHNADVGVFEKIFGLVVIPCDLVDEETAYVVDEQLGRFILELMAKRKAGNCGAKMKQ